MARLLPSFAISLATFAIAASVAFPGSATAQLPQLQGVQPVFNDQLGGWSAIHRNRPRPPANRPGQGGGGGNVINVPYPWWGGNVWGPVWGNPYGYNYYVPGFGFNHFGGWQNWSVMQTQPVQPIIVVQPQIVMPPAAVNPAANVGAMPPPAIANRAGGPMRDDLEIARRAAALKASNEAGRMRADQLIAEGDREFAAGSYRRAAQKYREAINRAQDYATAYFRAGHAYTANGDFDLAVTYIALALELARTPDRGGFTLDSLYRGDDAAKVNHLRALDVAAARQPLEGGLPFLTGILLHYDGNELQARDHFRRAADLPGRHRPYTAMFLPPEPKDAAAANAAGGNANPEPPNAP
jgi:hypothetical protein